MGRVRTKLVKKAARQVIEKYFTRLTLDFDSNKKVADEVALIPSKRLRNKIAGFITHLMKRIQRGGSVRGISLKLQEEERERRLDFLPERSALDVDTVEVDKDTMDMLRSLKFATTKGEMKGVVVAQPTQNNFRGGRQGGKPFQRGAKREPREPRDQQRAPREKREKPAAKNNDAENTVKA